MPTDTLYLLDGSNFLFRAYHAMPPMTTKAGTPTGAVFGFTNMVLRLLDEQKPSHLAVIFDAGGRKKRAALYPAYKQNRAETPEDLRPQFDLSRKVISALGLPVLDATEVEADDIIATLTQKARSEGLSVVIVSSDKDLMQLCQSEEVKLFDTMKEGGKGVFYGPSEIKDKFGVSPDQLGDMLALMGDSVDNVPGIPGVGEKTAAALINQFGSLSALLSRIDEINVRGAEKIKAALRANLDQVALSRRLVALDDQAEVGVGLTDLAVADHKRKNEELIALLRELEFTRILGRLYPAAETKPPQKIEDKVTAPKFSILKTEVLCTEEDVRTFVLQLFTDGEPKELGLSLPLSGTGDEGARTTPLCGIAIASKTRSGYIPLDHRYLGAPKQLSATVVKALVEPLFSDERVAKYVHGAKEAFLSLDGLVPGVPLPLRGVQADPALCSYLLDAASDHELSALSFRCAGVPLQTRATLSQSKRPVPLSTLDVPTVSAYAGSQAQAALFLGPQLLSQLDEAGHTLLREMELPLARVLATIERHGILLDTAVLHKLSQEVFQRLQSLEDEIQKQAGYEVNINSPKQLADLLFVRLGLQSSKKTKTGYSTDAEVLETLAAEHPIARQIHEHRGLAKLKNTYIDQLPLLIDKHTGRLHTSYQQVVAATGRLSSTEPNLQNVPIRTELGKQIRRAFVAPPEHLLVAADYSQIELRVLAHLSRDPLLLESFRSGQDVHERTAIEMFGPETGHKPEMRRVAKMINYGIVYGLTDFGLAARLGIEKTVARTYIKEYFVRYAGVKRYMDQLVADARRDTGAKTLLGRFRPLPEIHTKNYSVRSYAERMAKNTPIQGTAADILKRAMIRVQAELDRLPRGVARMLLTVHDELVFEVRNEAVEEVKALVGKTMQEAFQMDVPLCVDVCSGANWADCE